MIEVIDSEPMSRKEQEGWEYLMEHGMTEDFDVARSNVRYDFKTMTKKFGKAYIEYLRAAYAAKDELSDEDFCAYNGNIPKEFLDKIR